MPCIFCNSTKAPDSNGVCPDCGRVVSQSETAVSQSDTAAKESDIPSPTDENDYPIQQWHCSWLFLLPQFVIAVLIFGILAGGVALLYHYVDNPELDKWKSIIWIAASAIPVIYFIPCFLSFILSWFVKKYELHPRDFRLINGFFSTTNNSTLLESLWGMKFRQSFIQRIFGTGRITLFSDDVTTPVLRINDVGNARKRFNDLIRYQGYALDCSNVKVERKTVTDTSTQVWRYSWHDLINEILCGILITAGLIFIGWFFNWGNPYLRYSLLLIIPVLYWLWMIWTFIDKICCTSYTLYNATLVKESGIFNKSIDVYVLCHIQDCEMSQNLWQKIIGDIGNITLFLKWENKDATVHNGGGPISATKIDVLHGLQDHTKKYELLKERMLHERHRRQATTS